MQLMEGIRNRIRLTTSLPRGQSQLYYQGPIIPKENCSSITDDSELLRVNSSYCHYRLIVIVVSVVKRRIGTKEFRFVQ